MTRTIHGLLALLALIVFSLPNAVQAAEDDTFSQEEVMSKARGFFGETTKGLAKAVEKVFKDQGRPNAIITGEEASGAFGIGARYGKGELTKKAVSRSRFIGRGRPSVLISAATHRRYSPWCIISSTPISSINAFRASTVVFMSSRVSA